MPGPWDRDFNREHGQLSELPMGGLLSELLASEGVDPGEFVEVPAERLSPSVTGEFAEEPCPAESVPSETVPPDSGLASSGERTFALPGLTGQLWALNQAASVVQDDWQDANAVEPEAIVPAVDAEGLVEPVENPAPVLEAHDFAIPGLLFSLTEGVDEPTPEPEAELQPEPVACADPVNEEPVSVALEPVAEIAEAPVEEPPPIEVPVPHGRTNDLSNLIGAIDSEIAAAPDLPPGKTHELDKTHQRFVCFRLGGISYGLHMRLVREVDRIGRVTQVPGASKLICGLINLRGEILPLVDTGLLLESEPAAWPPSGYLLVVQSDPDGQPVALLVDELGGVAIVDPATVETNIPELEQSMAKHTLGMTEHRGRIVLLLDHRNLVTPEALLASAESGSLN